MRFFLYRFNQLSQNEYFITEIYFPDVLCPVLQENIPFFALKIEVRFFYSVHKIPKNDFVSNIMEMFN